MDSTRKLWIGLGALLAMGGQIYRKAPPMPERVVASGGTTLFERADIERGRQVWQSFGGMQLGSIWGLLIWMRVPGDTIFSVGAVTLTWFVVRLWIGPKGTTELPADTVTAKR